jgi:hypothetical protein
MAHAVYGSIKKVDFISYNDIAECFERESEGYCMKKLKNKLRLN